MCYPYCYMPKLALDNSMRMFLKITFCENAVAEMLFTQFLENFYVLWKVTYTIFVEMSIFCQSVLCVFVTNCH